MRARTAMDSAIHVGRSIARTAVRTGCHAVAAAVASVAVGWSLLALWHFDPWPRWIRIVVMVLWVAVLLWAFLALSRQQARRVLAAGLALTLLSWCFVRPSNDRDWQSYHARMPVVTFESNEVAIRNLRHASYRTLDDYDVQWYAARFDLAAVRSVDFVVEPFAGWRGPAHTFLTFGFDDGRHLAVSVEARRERGETFSALGGLFKQFEILYMLGDERDLIGQRLNARRHDVYLFPIQAERHHVRRLLVAMLRRADRLRRHPEFYHSITNTCHINIVRHFEDLAGHDLPPDLRNLLPGYADELAHELGLIDFSGTLEEARKRFIIRGPVPITNDGRAWSRHIRGRNGIPLSERSPLWGSGMKSNLLSRFGRRRYNSAGFSNVTQRALAWNSEGRSACDAGQP